MTKSAANKFAANAALAELLRNHGGLRSADPIYGVNDTVDSWWISTRTSLGEFGGIARTGTILTIEQARLVQRAVKAQRVHIG